MSDLVGSLFLLLVFGGLFLLYVVVYVEKRKRADIPLWRAVARFCGVFFGIAVPAGAVLIGLFELFEINPRYSYAIALVLLFGVLAPSWTFALGRIAATEKTTDPLVVISPAESGPPESERGSFQANTANWYRRNKWQAWAALAVVLVALGLIGAQMMQGYDMSPLLGLAAFYVILGVIIGGGNWFFTKTKGGIAIGKALGVVGNSIEGVARWVFKAALILAVGALLIWLAAKFFGSMPLWAAVIIVLLVLILLK